MRRSVSDNGPTGSDGVPSDTTEDDWSRGSAEDPDEVPSPSISPSPTPVEPPEHTGPITELDRKVRSEIFDKDSYSQRSNHGVAVAHGLEASVVQSEVREFESHPKHTDFLSNSLQVAYSGD